MNKFNAWTIAICCIAFTTFIACNQANKKSQKQKFSGINLEYMDTTVSPADDFYQFVNGKWLEEVKIPESRGRWGSFNELRQKTKKNTLKVLEKVSKNKDLDPQSAEYKAVTFYELAMDTTYLDSIGLQPIMPLLQEIEKIDSKKGIFDYMARNMAVAGNPFFAFYVSSGFSNSSINVLYLTPTGLGMPERDYYTKTDEQSIETQEKYRDMLDEVFQLFNKSADDTDIEEGIFNLEKSLASNRMTKEQRRNPKNRNNPMSMEELDALFPAAHFKDMLKVQGITDVDKVIVTDSAYFDNLDKVFASYSVQDIKNYLRWMLIHSYSNYLNSEIKATTFEFYGKELQGVDEMKPRWERVLSTANNVLDQAIGKLYVHEYFPPEAKATAKEMVENILHAFGERIKDLDWMTEATKKKALEKLSTFTVKIGYPDKWKDYSKLTIKSADEGGSYAGNMMLISQWEWAKDKAKLNKPVDKSEWFMGPQIVNAYYNPSYNEIVFPAAILQTPFFDFKADPAINYGGIGAVIGHEISHGFDDSGSKYDAQGNLNNWWTEEDAAAFKERTQALVEQFNNFKPFDDLSVNGKFTLGENIGDLGGINVAYQALQEHLRKHGNPGKIDGFTQDQRFFISWATIWRTKYKDEALRTQIKTDPHAPGKYRAIGPISNMDAFFKAFDVDSTDKMWKPKDKRVKIW